MKISRFIFLFLVIFPLFKVNGQVQEKIKLTGLFQTIISIQDNGSTGINIGKSEIGVWLKPFDFIKVRMIGKVYKDFSIKPFDLYAAIVPRKNFEIKIGQFRSPFSYENMLAPYEKKFIDESLSSKYLPTRDFGIGLDYKTLIIEINTAFFNGEGLNKPDINSKKDWVTRVAISIPKIFVFGMSYYSGSSGSDSILQKFSCINWQLISLKKHDFSFRSELTIFNKNSEDKYTAYASGGYLYKINQNKSYFIEPLIRLEFEKESMNIFKYYSTLGLNFHFDDSNTLRIQTNLKANLETRKDLMLSLSLFYALK